MFVYHVNTQFSGEHLYTCIASTLPLWDIIFTKLGRPHYKGTDPGHERNGIVARETDVLH